MSLTREQVIEYLSTLPVIQAIELTNRLADLWDVPNPSSRELSIPMVGMCRDPIPWDAQTHFDLYLVEAGPNKIAVIKTIREVTSLGLKEAKDLVEGAPKIVCEAMQVADAKDAQKKFDAAGAKTALR